MIARAFNRMLWILVLGGAWVLAARMAWTGAVAFGTILAAAALFVAWVYNSSRTRVSRYLLPGLATFVALRADAAALYRLYRLHQLQRRTPPLPGPRPRLVRAGRLRPFARALSLPDPSRGRHQPVAALHHAGTGRNGPQRADLAPVHAGRSGHGSSRHARAQHRLPPDRPSHHPRHHRRPPMAGPGAFHAARCDHALADDQPSHAGVPPSALERGWRKTCQRRHRTGARPRPVPRQLCRRTDPRTRRPRLAGLDRHRELPPDLHRPGHPRAVPDHLRMERRVRPLVCRDHLRHRRGARQPASMEGAARPRPLPHPPHPALCDPGLHPHPRLPRTVQRGLR